MLAATYYTNWDDIAGIAKLLTLCALICTIPFIATAIAPLVTICLACVAKTIIIAALAASPMLFIYIQKGR